MLKFDTAKIGIVLLVLLPFASPGQNTDKKVKKMLASADKLMAENRSIEIARQQYVQAAKLQPDNLEVNFKAGIAHLESINKQKSVDYFLKVYRSDPNYRFDLPYLLGRGYHYAMEFEEAIRYYSIYLDKLANSKSDDPYKVKPEYVERRIQECNNGKEFLANPHPLEITNLGSQINSPYGDYAPVINRDENLLIFTSRRFTGNVNNKTDENNLPYEDIFISYKPNDQWGPAKNIGSVVNTKFHDSSLGISPDGQRLFIYKDLNLGDIYESNAISETVWSKPYPVKDLNSAYSEKSITMDPDGQYVVFSSNRSGGFGGYDLYISRKNGNGWTKPVNLGEGVNTQYDEDAPYISNDGKFMYFSSKGWKGMGGYDIFKATYTESSRRWSNPVNLGYPVNSPDDDIHFISTKDGSRAYYASVREEGLGYTDIYMMTSLEGTFGDKTSQIIPVSISFQISDLKSGTAVEAAVRHNQKNYNAVGGKVSIRFEKGGFAGASFRISADGYQSQTLTFSIPQAGFQPQEIYKQVKLEPIVVPVRKKETRLIRNLYFDFDKYELKDEYFPQLEYIKTLLTQNPKARLMIIGHTDNVGTEQYNKLLSEKRAGQVADFLVRQGIRKNRLMIEGRGATQPLVSNDDESDGRELNRRVEFRLID